MAGRVLAASGSHLCCTSFNPWGQTVWKGHLHSEQGGRHGKRQRRWSHALSSTSTAFKGSREALKAGTSKTNDVCARTFVCEQFLIFLLLFTWGISASTFLFCDAFLQFVLRVNASWVSMIKGASLAFTYLPKKLKARRRTTECELWKQDPRGKKVDLLSIFIKIQGYSTFRIHYNPYRWT